MSYSARGGRTMQFSNVVHKPVRFPTVASCVDRLLSGESSSLGLSFQSGMAPSDGHARPQKVAVRACDARDAPEMAVRRRYTLDGTVTPPNLPTRGVDRNQMHPPHPRTSLGSVVFHDVNTSRNSFFETTHERTSQRTRCMHGRQAMHSRACEWWDAVPARWSCRQGTVEEGRPSSSIKRQGQRVEVLAGSHNIHRCITFAFAMRWTNGRSPHSTARYSSRHAKSLTSMRCL